MAQKTKKKASRRQAAPRKAAADAPAKALLAADAHHRAGRLDKAVAEYRRALGAAPSNPLVLNNLAVALRALGQEKEAVACLRKAIKGAPEHADAHYNLGNALQATGDAQGALEAYRRAITARPDYPAAYSNLGLLFRDLNQLDEAVQVLSAGLRAAPNDAQLHLNLGVVLDARKQPASAIACYRRSIALDGGSARAFHNLAAACFQADDHAAAVAAEDQAIARDPDFAEAHALRAQALCAAGRLDDALAGFDQALRCDAENLTAHLGRARAALLKGDFAPGLDEYEWRWRRARQPQRGFDEPEWDGSPLRGRRILLYAEQGLGDSIQFLRYVPMVAALGGQVLVEVPPVLVRLARTVAGAAQVIAQGQTLPGFDVQAALLSLPRIMETRLETIPAKIPYLSPPPSTPAPAPDPQDHVKVGLVWAGNPEHENDRNRSVPLERFLPLLAVPKTRFYSFQKGAGVRDIPRLGCQGLVRDLSRRLRDFADTAKFLSQLDLLIAVDTAPAHLAGALGIDCWLLLPFAPDWRWILGRDDSPWYPKHSLYRQPAQGDWDSVLARLAADLAARAEMIPD